MDEMIYTAAAPKIGPEQVRQAARTLQKYRQGKAQLEQRLIENEQFWKLRHWQEMEKKGCGGNGADPRPTSAWLVNCILSKHADAMDCYPEPTVLPREPGDAAEAEKLSRILPVILKRSRFRRVYADAWWRKLKSGCAVYGVFWNGEKDGGLGEVEIRSMDLLQLFWQPGVTDIQDSAHFFATELRDDEELLRQYPQLEGKLGGKSGVVSRYLYDDTVDTGGKSLVVDWYYHTVENGRKVLQFCKFVGETVLYATENDPEVTGGWYQHGKYPFVFDPLFPAEGTPCGYGYVDLCKSPQQQIDLMNQAILKNALCAATPRFFIRSDGAVNEEEYADWTQPFVHTNGNLGADSIAPIRAASLDGVYVSYLQSKIAEMKETAGNRDVTSGGTSGGVTAATAIAALQEAGGKLSRNMIADGYDAFGDVVTLVIELVRQFYGLRRQFRLLGRAGEFMSYDNAGLRGRMERDAFGEHYRVPEFDLEIDAQEENPYQTMEHNQLALQLYRMGFFRADMAEQSLRCLALMDFKNKDAVVSAIDESRAQAAEVERLRAQLLEIAAVVDGVKGTDLAGTLRREFEARGTGGAPVGGVEKAGGGSVEDMRRRSRLAVQPR